MLLGVEIGDLHIELTSRCTLACPRCQRTADPEQLQVGDLPLAVIEATLTRPNFPALRYINLCGNYGDPIYHPQFHEVIAHVRHEGFKLRIETNGSYRPAAWWARTAQILSRADQVQFSIDGLEDTNHLYRVNARWPDILAAIEQLRGSVYLVWKFIVFRHNQHQIESARERAQTLGFDEFRLIRSSRFDGRWRDPSGIDPLKPDPQWVGGRKAISEQVATLRMARVRIEPRCARGENVFISSEGYFLPCCYAHILLRRTIAAPERAREPDVWFYRHREAFDLTKRPFAEVAADPLWDELRRMWAEDRAPEICYRYCGLPEDSSVGSLDDVRRGDRMALPLKP